MSDYVLNITSKGHIHRSVEIDMHNGVVWFNTTVEGMVTAKQSMSLVEFANAVGFVQRHVTEYNRTVLKIS